MSFPFTIDSRDGAARTGLIQTPRGPVSTPAFMPVGTAATVKALMMDQVRSTGAEVILGNTYHLMLRPGAERVARLGGLHAFSGWSGPMLTDSGGFQVWSLSALTKLTEEGARFKSHIDGSSHLLTPERSIEIQADLLGSDFVMQLDECTDFPVSHERAAQSLRLSARWGARCKAAFGERDAQALLGIVQGSTFADLRQESADRLQEIGFDAYAIGGLAVGEGLSAMLETIEATVTHLPWERPRYLMGVGKPIDLVESALRGVDMFDCVLPTRAGRHGQAWSDAGPINLKAACFADDESPLDAESDCPASHGYSKAYLHHLVRSDEMLAPVLISWHNLSYYQGLMRRIRAAIRAGEMARFAAEFRAGLVARASQSAE